MKTAKKLIFGTILLIMLIIVPLSVQASATEIVDSGMYENNINYTLYDDGLIKFSGTGKMMQPSFTLSEFLPVVPWSEYREAITSVVIEEGITHIEGDMFYKCTNLKSVSIPDSVVSIGSNVFSGCTSLTDISIPDSITSIGGAAFYGCTSLTDISIPDTVTYVGARVLDGTAYYENDSNWENGGLYIGKHLIGAKLTSSEFEIKSGTKTITGEVFRDQVNLTSIIIPDGITYIDDRAFYGCTSLESIIIPDSVTYIGEEAFEDTAYYNNESNWENDVLYIGKHLIKAKETVSGDYTIKSGTLTLAYEALFKCENIESLTIPDSLKGIADGAISCCENLKSISVGENNKYYTTDEYGVLFNKDKTKIIQYPLGNERTEYSIPNGVTTIGYAAFAGAPVLEKIEIPNTVTTIEKYALQQMTNITSIVIPESVIDVADFTISYCFNLTSITVSSKTMGKCMFECSINLKDVTINEGITYIGKSAFYYCQNLTSISIPKSVNYIADFAFNECSNLTDIYYSGTEEEWNAITICEGNEPLLNATVHFTKPCDHTDPNLETKLIEGKKPTCTQTGVADAYACAQCGVIVRGGEELPTIAHTYQAFVTAPTCTDGGFTVYACVCGDTYTADIVEPVDHVDKNSDNKCDMCAKELGEKEPENPEQEKKSFWERLLELIRKVIEWIKNLFR